MPVLIILLVVAIVALLCGIIYSSNNEQITSSNEEIFKAKTEQKPTPKPELKQEPNFLKEENDVQPLQEKAEIKGIVDLEKLKCSYPHMDFYIDEIKKNPYFANGGTRTNFSIEDIENLFNICLEKQMMSGFIRTIESYLYKNYISNNSIRFTQLYIRAILLQYVTYGDWCYQYSQQLIKAFICIFENAKTKSAQDIDNEIITAYSTIVELLTTASKTPFVRSMKDPEEILQITELLINLYCLFPTAIEEYLDELQSCLANQFFAGKDQKIANEIISFIEEYQSKVFNVGLVDVRKYKAYDRDEIKEPKLDSCAVKYFDETNGTCVLNIEFMSPSNSKTTLYVSALDAEKNSLPFDSNDWDRNFQIPYINRNNYKCGMVSVTKTIFAFPKNTKFIEVMLNSQKRVCELSINDSEEKNFIIENKVLKKYIGTEKTVNIPSGIVAIDSLAFWECENITTITIPDGVTSIGSHAFGKCSNLSKIDIPNGVEIIENDAFYNCTNLKEIHIPNSVKKIGNRAFAYCINLSNITFPSEIDDVGLDVFRNCPSLLDDNNMIIINQVLYQYGGKEANFVVPNNVTAIGQSAFDDNQELRNVIIQQGCHRICTFAFCTCTNLETITIPSDLISIASGAVISCRSLKKIIIKGPGKGDADSCDNEFNSLKDYIPNVQRDAFQNCSWFAIERVYE